MTTETRKLVERLTGLLASGDVQNGIARAPMGYANRRELNALAKLQTEAVNALPDLLATITRLTEERDALREAVTPSAETKAAYHGEFQFNIEYADEDGNSYWSPHLVPWDQVKEIMASIAARATLVRSGSHG
jgi:hypothetical protein